jgi:GNAT superfamily N-acetyltransferase
VEAARPAQAGDIARLAELARTVRAEMEPLRGGSLFLRREARPEPVDDSLTAALEAEDHLVVAGTVNDFVVGYAVARLEHLGDGGRLGVVEDLFVEEGARGVGVGEAMMNQVMEWFSARDVVGVDAMALPGDRNTKNFFERSGFTARLLVMHHKAES